MPVELLQGTGARLIEVRLSGRLLKEDYERMVPAVEHLVKEGGKIRMLVVMHDFHGWTAGALWEDMKFDAKHFGDIERLALVGETNWQKGMSVFCRPFTTAAVRCFGQDQIEEARRWLDSDGPDVGGGLRIAATG